MPDGGKREKEIDDDNDNDDNDNDDDDERRRSFDIHCRVVFHSRSHARFLPHA